MALNYLFTSFCIYDNYKNVLHAFGAAARTRTTLINQFSKQIFSESYYPRNNCEENRFGLCTREAYIYIYTHIQ